jgi:hypothetical protein
MELVFEGHDELCTAFCHFTRDTPLFPFTSAHIASHISFPLVLFSIL